jgi:hypothetical protein
VFENRVPRKIFGPERQEVTGSWGEFYEGEVVIISVISRRVRCGGHVGRMGEKRRTHILCEHKLSTVVL